MTCVVDDAVFELRNVIELSGIRVLRVVRHLKVIVMLAVNSHEVHILASAFENRARVEILEVLLELSNVNLIKRPWSFELTDIQGVGGLHLRFLTDHHDLLYVSLLGGLVHQRIRFVKDVFFTRGAYSFLAPFLLAACFPGLHAANRR